MILSQPYNHKSDIWGLGIILYELLSKTSPFNGIIIEHTIHNILNSTTLIKGKLSEPLKNLLSHLLSKDPSERPSTEEILRHEWIVMNLQRHDISFLKHPAFRNCHKLGDLLKYSKKEDSSELKKSYDIRKITFFKKNNSQHEVFLHKRSEEEMQRFPNIFHDGYFNRSYTQKSLNKSINEVKNQSLYSISPIRQTKIFEPMRQAYKNVNVNNINNYNNSSRKEYNKKNNYNDNINNDSEEYELIQHLNERHSIGNQEEQRFSHPVLVEKRKKNHNMQKNSGVYQENSKNLNKSQNSLDKGNDISLKMENKDTKSKFFKRNDVSERSQNHTQNDMSGYSTKSNNQKLYFDHDFNDKD